MRLHFTTVGSESRDCGCGYVKTSSYLVLQITPKLMQLISSSNVFTYLNFFHLNFFQRLKLNYLRLRDDLSYASDAFLLLGFFYPTIIARSFYAHDLDLRARKYTKLNQIYNKKACHYFLLFKKQEL